MLLIALLALVSGRAQAYSALYAFGDSLTDTGNVFAANGIPLPPYFNGRFSNGPVWIETLAANLGLSATPATAVPGGTNFAFGGAATGSPPAVIGPTSPPTLIQQAGLFLSATGGVADPNALYVVFGGGNDVRGGDITGSAGNIATVISTLAGAGAQNFLVPNLPDIGQTPEAIAGGPALQAGATFLSTTFNTQLAGELANLTATLGVNIIQFDTFAFLNNILANPASFGFTNVNTPCYSGTTGIGGPGTVCADPSQYVFWDGIHPTAATHQLFGDLAFQAVIPLPAAAWLFGSALGLLGWIRRRHA
ncbi:MAG: G-D-S-L family lipolytic protein [Gammaproteobacteria bacterium]|nr:MAG: G-D-S-L family lipolytic protein [Gammaproteobacteria bacterium]